MKKDNLIGIGKYPVLVKTTKLNYTIESLGFLIYVLVFWYFSPGQTIEWFFTGVIIGVMFFRVIEYLLTGVMIGYLFKSSTARLAKVQALSYLVISIGLMYVNYIN